MFLYIHGFAGEAVNNASGLGFSGYDENGKETWDLINNVNIIKIEVKARHNVPLI